MRQVVSRADAVGAHKARAGGSVLKRYYQDIIARGRGHRACHCRIRREIRACQACHKLDGHRGVGQRSGADDADVTRANNRFQLGENLCGGDTVIIAIFI